MPRLVFLDACRPQQSYELVVEKTSVGRGDPNALIIRDAAVSRTHCEILVWGTEVIVRDLGSRNGTLMNGCCLRGQQAPMQAGQVVQIGPVKARLEFKPPSSIEPSETLGCARSGERFHVGSERSDTDTAESVTAYHAHWRYRRALAQMHKTTQPKPARMVLVGNPDAGSDEPTTAVPVVVERPSAVAQPNVADSRRGESRGLGRVFARCARFWQERFGHEDSAR